MSDTIMTNASIATPHMLYQPLLNGAQMRELFAAYELARDNYSEDDEERTGAAYDAAQGAILDARTVDPEGIAIKLRILIAQDIGHHDELKLMIEDLTRPVVTPPVRRVPSRLRPLWQAYQAAWKEVSDAGDAEDEAMLARPKDAPRMSTQAEKDAKKRFAKARKAYDAASEALLAAPTRTADDALCRIEHAIDLADEGTDADLINSLNKALRILRKANVEA